MGICPQSLTFSTVILYHCHYQYCKSKGLSSSIIFEFILITGTVKLCGAAKQTQVLQLQLHISVELPPSVLDIVRPGLGTHSHSPLVLCTFTPLIESRSYLLNFSVWNNQLISKCIYPAVSTYLRSQPQCRRIHNITTFTISSPK